MHAGTRFLQVSVKEIHVNDGYLHEGEQRYVKYVVNATIGRVEHTKPFAAEPKEKNIKRQSECATVEEAEKRGDEIDNG